MSQAEPDLSLDAAVHRNKADIVVTATVKNRGKAPQPFLTDDYYCSVHIGLLDAAGKALAFFDRRSAMGPRDEPDFPQIVTLAPGGTHALETFTLRADSAQADGGPFHWALQDYSGQKLQVEFGYELTRERAARIKTPGIAIGAWTSARVEIEVPPLTAKVVRRVLHDQRTFTSSSALPLLIEALNDKKSETREYVAHSLGGLKNAAAVPALVDVLLKDSARDPRLAAAYALRDIASVDSLEALVAATTKDADDLVRYRAAEALTHLPDPRAVRTAIVFPDMNVDRLRDMAKLLPADVVIRGARSVLTGGAEAHYRIRAVELLGLVPGEGLRIALLIRGTRDPDRSIRSMAVRALAESKSACAVGPLVALAKDPDVGDDARLRLNELTGEQADDWQAWWDGKGRKKFPQTPQSPQTWSIEDKTATREEFEARVKSMKEIQWTCKETAEGGITTQVLRDDSGADYEVQHVTDLEGSRSTIRKKKR